MMILSKGAKRHLEQWSKSESSDFIQRLDQERELVQELAMNQEKKCSL